MVDSGESGGFNPGNCELMMKTNEKTTQLWDESAFAGSSEFYNIPLLGEAHLDDDGGGADSYKMGESLANVKNDDAESVTMCALDDGLRSAGILKGDLLTIFLKVKMRDGDIAAVRLGSRIYVRKIYYDRQHIRLESSEPSAVTLVVEPKAPGFEVIGKVAAVFREL